MIKSALPEKYYEDEHTAAVANRDENSPWIIKWTPTMFDIINFEITRRRKKEMELSEVKAGQEVNAHIGLIKVKGNVVSINKTEGTVVIHYTVLEQGDSKTVSAIVHPRQLELIKDVFTENELILQKLDRMEKNLRNELEVIRKNSPRLMVEQHDMIVRMYKDQFADKPTHPFASNISVDGCNGRAGIVPTGAPGTFRPMPDNEIQLEHCKTDLQRADTKVTWLWIALILSAAANMFLALPYNK